MTDFEKFQQAQARLFSLVTDLDGKRFSLPKTHAKRQQDMGDAMARTADFLRFAGHPEAAFPAVHVTGTSGKGSVTMMIAALLSGMGYRTGSHTSPYLQLPTEKLVVDGRPIGLAPFADLIEHFETVHDAWGAAAGPYTRLRYTEAWTAVTFLFLAQQNLDWAVVEAGMGGRLDPTNHVPSKLAVITNVALDHVKSLGPELKDIAHHKAGIIKPGRPALTAVQQPDLYKIVAAEAAEKEAPLYSVGKEGAYRFEICAPQQIRVMTPDRSYGPLVVGPQGHYQLGNAALAIAAVDLLKRHGYVDREINVEALADFSCPGRMEVVDKAPLTILDGAHNPHKMRALVKSLQLNYAERSIIAIVGGIINKEMQEILAELTGVVTHLIATAPQVPGKPAVQPQAIVETVNRLPQRPKSVSAAETIEVAIEHAREMATPNDLILITGSLYLVGAARELWYPVAQRGDILK